MTHREILSYCLEKPGAYLDFPFGPEVTVVKLRGRIFAQIFFLRGEPKATFNCDPPTGQFYRARYPGAVTRGYHCPRVQQPYFNTVALGGAVPGEVLREMIDHAYSHVRGKLPKYIQRELEES